MKRHAVLEPWQYDRVRRKRQRLIEYYSRPSDLALDEWEYVISIGSSRCPPGHRLQKGTDRNGYVLHYLFKGELVHIIEGRSYLAREGTVCLMDFTKGHRQRNERARAVHLWWILFDGRSMRRVFRELGARMDPLFEGVNRRRFEALFRELWMLTSKKPVAYEARSHAVLNTILAELFASRPREPISSSLIPPTSKLSEKVQMIVDFIQHMYSHSIALKQIEPIVGLNMFHLSRKFRAEVGMAPIQYLTQVRIAHAKRLLTRTDRSVVQIARLVGFPDANYFARLFRKHTNQTPQDYRKSNAERVAKHQSR